MLLRLLHYALLTQFQNPKVTKAHEENNFPFEILKMIPLRFHQRNLSNNFKNSEIDSNTTFPTVRYAVTLERFFRCNY